MNIATKKTIAREGLIVITLVAISLSLLGCSIWFSRQSSDLPDFGKIYELTDQETKFVFRISATSLEHLEERIQDLEKLEKKDIPEYARKNYSEEINTITKKKYLLELKSTFENSLFWFSILCYPIYLITRFVIWATKTLRKS